MDFCREKNDCKDYFMKKKSITIIEAVSILKTGIYN